MIKYWYCVNIPPRSLVDLKKADEKKRICDQLEKTTWKSKKKNKKKNLKFLFRKRTTRECGRRVEGVEDVEGVEAGGRWEFDFPEVEMEGVDVSKCGVGPRGGGGACGKDGRGDRQR
jgi:hypothetical protein